MLENIRSKIGLTSFQLKIIAIITMTIDHVGVVMMKGTPYYNSFRIVGRIAFPIYCFLLTEGFIKTRDVKKYALRLFIFAIISEIPFNLMSTGYCFSLGYQNVFFTLLLGLLLLCWYKEFTLKNKHVIAMLGVPVFMAIAYFINTDYSWWGVMLIFLFYAFRDKEIYMVVFAAAAMILNGGHEIYAIIALVPILLYNGEKGRSMKYFFYAYYPVHMLILFGIKYCIDNFAK